MNPVQDQPQQNIPPEIQPQQPLSPVELPPQIPSVSPIKKFLPFIVAGIIFLLLLSGVLVLSTKKSNTSNIVPTPTIRPTATPIIVPTLPEVSPTAGSPTMSATISATLQPKVSEKNKNKLVFIKDGDIYESDLFSFTLLVKNKTMAGDKLFWSPKGNFLSWRPKSKSGIQDTVTVYDRIKQSTLDIIPDTKSGQNTELIDYAWSPDEKQLALVYKDTAYNIALSQVSSSGSAKQTKIINKNTDIKQLLWPNENAIIFSGEDGITSLNVSDPASVSSKLLISNKNVQNIKLSPVNKKILYSVGTAEKSDLYLVNIDGNFNQLLKVDTNKIDMGTTEIPANVVNNGFTSFAVFFPKGDRLMVGFHYLEGLPLTGIYDLKDESFKALIPFPLANGDLLIHDFLLLGPRLSISAGQNSWQVSLFTMEAGSKLGMIRAIPGATSPSYFGAYEN